MWIARTDIINTFLSVINKLDNQIILIRGCRQVGKTAFVLDALKSLKNRHVLVNANYPRTFSINGIEYLGRDFIGSDPSGSELLKNLATLCGEATPIEEATIVFIDEVDQYPPVLEAIQTLALHTNRYKFIFTGSNLENIIMENASTGRKCYFDLYPVTFPEYLSACGEGQLLKTLSELSLDNLNLTEYQDTKALQYLDNYVRIGGMPKVLGLSIAKSPEEQIAHTMADLVVTIEENVKAILGEKSRLYEYEDVLRQIAIASINTLKFSRLQVQHAGRSESKRLVNKSVGARIVHKVRLFDSQSDLSKYIIADTGIANYLLASSQLLRNKWSGDQSAIIWETFVGTSLITQLITRDDLSYWKSPNKAEVEFFLRAPRCMGIDVKSSRGNFRSLASLSLLNPELDLIVKISREKPNYIPEYEAKDSTSEARRKIPALTLPPYLVPFLLQMIREGGELNKPVLGSGF